MTKYKKGKIVKATVSGIESYGIFVTLDEYYSGLIHISEISNDFVKDVSKFAKIDDILYAKILAIDDTNKHIKLSIKATQPKNRYRSNYMKPKFLDKYKDFKPLNDKLNEWIMQQLKEKKKYD